MKPNLQRDNPLQVLGLKNKMIFNSATTSYQNIERGRNELIKKFDIYLK
jgi:hypothetical protein